MKSTTKRKLGAVGLRGLGVASAVGIPVIAVLDVFPLFNESGEVDGKKLGVGGIMVLLIALVGLRRQIWPVIKSKLHFTSAWVLIGWGLLFALLLGIEKIVPLLPGLRTICIAGLVGTGIGQGLDTAAGFLDHTKEDTKKDEEVKQDA